MLWGVDILEILAASLFERSTVYDPSFATMYVQQGKSIGNAQRAYLCELAQKSVAIEA
jgi:hypothetical protein